MSEIIFELERKTLVFIFHFSSLFWNK